MRRLRCRSESKGRIKGVSLRLEDGKVLVLGYRCKAQLAAIWCQLQATARHQPHSLLNQHMLSKAIAALIAQQNQINGLHTFMLRCAQVIGVLAGCPAGKAEHQLNTQQCCQTPGS